MLASANDVALQIAEQIGGSVDGFVQMMNNRAVELGCTNTVFTNPTGLPDENQHTTAHDMALITKAAIDNESFRTIAETTSYTIPATNVSGGERVLTNNFSMLNNTNASYYQYCLGGREGYTEASGSNFGLSEQKKTGVSLIALFSRVHPATTAAEAVSLLQLMDLTTSSSFLLEIMILIWHPVETYLYQTVLLLMHLQHRMRSSGWTVQPSVSL
mgnify:CR=1 FL=1